MDSPHRTNASALRRYLLEELRAVSDGFEKGQLAYLAATSKVEIQVRDELAWRLHQRLVGDGLTVAREWRRADLVILRGLDPLAVVQAKALYAFDVRSDAGRSRYVAKVRADLAKAAKLAPAAEAYALVLCSSVDGAIQPHSPQARGQVLVRHRRRPGQARDSGHRAQRRGRDLGPRAGSAGRHSGGGAAGCGGSLGPAHRHRRVAHRPIPVQPVARRPLILMFVPVLSAARPTVNDARGGSGQLATRGGRT
jgi:hypothetical protein